MHKIKCTLLLFDVSQRLLNSIIHPSFGNFVILGIHHNLVVRRPMYVIMVLATHLSPSAFASVFLIIPIPSGLLDIIFIIPLILHPE